MKIPQRQSLLLQTTEILRCTVADGTWDDGFLPGERELSRRLQVSRPTLRAALDILEREKRIETVPGRRRRILQKSEPLKRSSPTTVVLVSQTPLYAMSRNRLFLFDHLHRALEENNIHLESISNPAFGSDRPQNALNRFEDSTENRTFLLALTSREVQQWFSDRGVPCLIIGSSFPGVNISTIECDYTATGRHAAGTLLGRGHRKLLVFVPRTNLAGDVETEETFLETVSSSGHREAECRVLRYGEERGEILQQWEEAQKLQPCPTAAFSIYPRPAVTLMTHLLAKGVRVPNEFSILCRDSSPLFSWMNPSIAHYEMPLQHFAVRLTSLVMEMVKAGMLPLRQTTILPELRPNESLASAVAPASH